MCCIDRLLRSLFFAVCCLALFVAAAEDTLITDQVGRNVTVPKNIEQFICSGSGCLRLLTYLGAHDRIVAVDGIEVRGSPIDVRPYAIANPQLRQYPIFGEFRGRDNPELIVALDPRPQVIFKMFAGSGRDPNTLQKKTGIPVIALKGGTLPANKDQLYNTFRFIGDVVGARARAEEVISFIENILDDLEKRTQSPSERTCFIGGLGHSGPHGIRSTDTRYAPFEYLSLKNAAVSGKTDESTGYSNVSKEYILFGDPDIIFIDMSTLRLGPKTNAIEQLRTDKAFRNLRAVKNNQVYGLFPNMSYNQNVETVLANAYFVGKTVYPQSFSDIEPLKKAEEIAVFFNGGPAFAEINEMFENRCFSQIPVR